MVEGRLGVQVVVGLLGVAISGCGDDSGSKHSGSAGAATGAGGAVMGIGGTATGLGGAVPGLGGAVTGLGGAVPGLGGAVPGLGGAIPGLGGAVTGLGGAVSGLGGAIPGLGGAVTGLGGAVPGLGGAVPGLGGAVPGLGGAVPGFGGAVPGVGGDLGSGGTGTGGDPGNGGTGTGGDPGTTGGAAGASGAGGSGGSGGGTSHCGDPASDTLSGSLGQGQLEQLVALELEGGTVLDAQMTGTGDADLYVRFGMEPSTEEYDCRPYAADANESCSQQVPQDGATVYVAVRGYAACTYDLTLAYVPRCCTSNAECDDGNPCTDDLCDAEVCAHSNNTASCDDTDACTSNDACSLGICAGTPHVCPEGEVCVEGACAPRPTLTLYTTCVEDDLDPEDRSLMVEEMTAIGYADIGSNTNVSEAALNELLARDDITVLYHTGHGFEGGIATAGGSLTYSGANTVNVENAIFATCLTLTDNRWPTKMGATSRNILGYTDLSYDGVDNSVVQDFAAALDQGESPVRAWYSANVIQSTLSDRWCGYTREASDVVEYSARTNNVPALALSSSLQQVDPLIRVDSALLADTRTFAGELAQLALYEYLVVADDDHLVTFLGDPAEFLAKAPVTEDQAANTAEAWLGTGLPDDAVLEGVHGIEATVGSGGAPTTVAFRLRYVRVIDGMPVYTNGRAHHLEVVVDDGGVAVASILWPTLDVYPVSSPAPLLGVDVAFASAIDDLRRLAKQPVTIVDVLPCYGSTAAGAIVPAYAFLDARGDRLIVDARTGDLVL